MEHYKSEIFKIASRKSCLQQNYIAVLRPDGHEAAGPPVAIRIAQTDRMNSERQADELRHHRVAFERRF